MRNVNEYEPISTKANMTTNWLGVLLFNKTLTDEEYEDIPYPRLELHTHVFWKHVQVEIKNI